MSETQKVYLGFIDQERGYDDVNAEVASLDYDRAVAETMKRTRDVLLDGKVTPYSEKEAPHGADLDAMPDEVRAQATHFVRAVDNGEYLRALRLYKDSDLGAALSVWPRVSGVTLV